MSQKAFSFDKVTVGKIARGAAIAGGGAVLTYILQAIASTDFGNFTPIVVAVCGIALNALKEYMKGA